MCQHLRRRVHHGLLSHAQALWGAILVATCTGFTASEAWGRPLVVRLWPISNKVSPASHVELIPSPSAAST